MYIVLDVKGHRIADLIAVNHIQHKLCLFLCGLYITCLGIEIYANMNTICQCICNVIGKLRIRDAHAIVVPSDSEHDKFHTARLYLLPVYLALPA